MKIYNSLLPALLLSTSLMTCREEPKKPASLPRSIAVNNAKEITTTQAPEPSPVAEMPQPARDTAFVDSMMRLEVTLPPILDDKAYDTATVNGFTRLATLTRGDVKLLASSELLEENIISILCKNANDYADALFMVDNTGSMGDDIAAVKKGMNQIIDVLRDKKGVRLAIATYRDKQFDSTNWFSFHEFETDYDAAKKFTDGMTLVANNDLPESVYEAFSMASSHHFWRSPSKRLVLIIGDARGKNKAEGGEYNIEDMIAKAAESRIRVNFYPLIVTPYSEQYRRHDLNPKPATVTHLIEQVYPNPTKGIIYIKMAKPGRYRVAVYSMTGELIEDRYMDDYLWRTDLQDHKDGLYAYRVTDANNQFEVGKFILKRD